MLKLLLCIFSAMTLAVVTLQLRQQRLELNYQSNRLHNQIESYQGKLWNQQLQIAVYTAPNAITKTVGDQKLNMVHPTPLPAGVSDWTDVKSDPPANAE